MARTQEEIYNDMVADKETNSELNELLPNPDNWSKLYSRDNFAFLANTIIKGLSVSKVAIWRLMYFVMSRMVFIQEGLYDQHLAEVNTAIENREIGTLPWYASVAKDFQFGFELTWNGSKYEYSDTTSTAAEDSKIIFQSAAVEAATQVIVKVAKDNGSGVPTVLTAEEETAFTAYATQVKPAGIALAIYNFAADDFQINYTVKYDPLVLNASGELLADSTVTDLVAGDKPVDVAIDTYIGSLPFNSVLAIDKLTDAVQSSEGVDIPVCTVAAARYGANPYTDILLDSTQEYQARAGYLTKISSTITYEV